MKYQEKCNCCWHVRTAYTEKMSVPYVDILKRLVAFYRSHWEGAQASDPRLWLSKAKYTTIQKLKYWGLIKSVGDFKREPTQLWFLFEAWKVAIREVVAHIWNTVLPEWHAAREGKENKLVYVHDIVEKEYKKWEAYKWEKRWLLHSKAIELF